MAILAQPDWRSAERLSQHWAGPRLGVLLSSGNIDSMVAHYTAAKKRRQRRRLFPGGNEPGLRPDRAVIVYCQQGAGGLSRTCRWSSAAWRPRLRRFAHYDYWEDKVRRSILCDSQRGSAGLRHGGARRPGKLRARLASGTAHPWRLPMSRAPAYLARDTCCRAPILRWSCPSFEAVSHGQAGLCPGQPASSTRSTTPSGARPSSSATATGCWWSNPPAMPLTTAELDCRGRAALRPGTYHPMYDEDGRRARHRGGALLRHPQPGLLRGVQLLLPGLPPGADYHLPQP